MNRRLCFLLALVIAACFFSVKAWAAGPGFKQPSIVDEGQKIKNVFLYGEDGVISGEVTDEVVVINGNLTLTRTARIHDSVFLIGGELNREPGAELGRGIFQINLANENLNSLLLGLGTFALLELAKLFLALLIFLASLASLFMLKHRVARAKAMLETKMFKTGLLGLFAAIGLGLVFIALTVTVWGIPVAILLGILILILLPVGLGALNGMIGELLLKSFTWGQKPFYQVLIGSIFTVALFNFPVLGILWGALVLIFTIGAFAASLLPENAGPNA
jgi:hypothetical protein